MTELPPGSRKDFLLRRKTIYTMGAPDDEVTLPVKTISFDNIPLTRVSVTGKSRMYDPDLQMFKLFLTVHDLGNITRAAEHSNIAVSAVTKRLQDLEAHYHVRLFDRQPAVSDRPRRVMRWPMISGIFWLAWIALKER